MTVKGIAERTVSADLAIWPLRVVATGDDLAAVQQQMGEQQTAVLGFLDSAGVSADEIELQDLQVTDLYAQAYR